MAPKAESIQSRSRATSLIIAALLIAALIAAITTINWVPPVTAPPPSPTPPPTGMGQSIAVPAYFYPGSTWTQLEAGAPTVGLAIINPNDGPGTAVDSNYRTQVGSSQAKGIRAIGYVYTSYGKRPLATVKAEIDQHYAWYGVDGIFFDETTADCADLEYYQELHDYVKAKGGTAEVALNPGTRTSECLMAASDIIITFEDTYANYQQWQPSGWETAYDASRFWHLIIDTSPEDLANAIALSKSRNIGWVYATNDTLPNPWDTLPTSSYWNQQLQLASG